MRSDDLSKIEITSLAALENAIAEVESLFNQVVPLWRGHANETWPLRADAFRASMDRYSYQEVTLLRYFMAQAESRTPRCPDGDDLAGWLMFARHYGLPTRLL